MKSNLLDSQPVSAPELMLGDEAVALGAIDAGITGAYAYPGTPSTEIFARVIAEAEQSGAVTAHWAANEKSAMEEALGASMAGRRALVTMKHVGLNVAMDPFMNATLLGLGGGVVVTIADDPGMHSSQNEQDSRFLADFARVPVLEPATAQEAYEMTRQAFDLSERFGRPVMVRLVTRLCHERAGVRRSPARAQSPVKKVEVAGDWILLPANSRRLWSGVLAQQPEVDAWSNSAPENFMVPGTGDLAVITTGIARRYFMEVKGELEAAPPHLHIATYPIPLEKLRELAKSASRILVIEEGYPYVERYLNGLLPGELKIEGRMSGALPASGELTPGLVRLALGLERLERFEMPVELEPTPVPGRPPQLCQGCIHRDAYAAMELALKPYGPRSDFVVAGDIGCYTLGALPPYQAIDSCVCMGASIGMAKGASDAGLKPALAVIGDSTFCHSGVTPLMDAAAHDTDMTVLILDNETTAMTGQQPTVLSDSRFVPLILGIGVDPDHVHQVRSHPKKVEELAELIGKEIEHPGLSVIIVVRECVQSLLARKKS